METEDKELMNVAKKVAQITGWSRFFAAATIKEACIRTGCTYDGYLEKGFYDLTEEEQNNKMS